MSELKKTLAKIAKEHGSGTVDFFGNMDNIEVERISSGLPSLDKIIGGGIPVGRIIEIFGPSSSGKTSLAIKFLAEVQKADLTRKVAYIDVEQALDPRYSETLGLNMSEVVFSQPGCMEDALDIIGDLVSTGEISAIVLDSVAQLASRKEIEGDMETAEMGIRARLLGKFFRKVTPALNDKRCTLFCINQVRTNIGVMHGDPEVRPGGQALPFACSLIIRTSTKKLDEKSGETTMRIRKNKVGKPFGETTIRINYGTGYDVTQDVITVAKTLGVIKRRGAMYDFQEITWKGEDNMRTEIGVNEKLFDRIKQAVAEAPDKIVDEKGEDTNSFTLDAIVADVSA